jgi:glycosyltransferase involved in cell wall biosynthesis
MSKQKTKPIKLSIVIGALNEQKYIIQTLNSLLSYLKTNNMWRFTEVIIVTPPSKDGTIKMGERYLKAKPFAFSQQIQPADKVGKGRDIRLGVLASSGKYICYFDADGAAPLKYLSVMYQQLTEGKADIVAGYRKFWHHKKPTRNISAAFANAIIRIIIVPGAKDSPCGFKGFSRSAGLELFEPLKSLKWAFDVEILARARAKKLTVNWIKLAGWSDPKNPGEGLAGESQASAIKSTVTELVKIAYCRVKKRY